jgi:hypothetical protein
MLSHRRVASVCCVVCGVGNGGCSSSSFLFRTRTCSITKKIVSRAKKNRGLETQTRLESPFIVPGVNVHPRRRLGQCGPSDVDNISWTFFCSLTLLLSFVVSK